MEYIDRVKEIKKEYYKAIRTYYNANRLILKMVISYGLGDLSEVDINFRTCAVHNFSDKHIDKMWNKDIKKVIQTLRARGISCVYTSRAIQDLMSKLSDGSENYTNLSKQLNIVNDKLYELAKQSIIMSNNIARGHNLPTLFENGNIKLEDLRCTTPK